MRRKNKINYLYPIVAFIILIFFISLSYFNTHKKNNLLLNNLCSFNISPTTIKDLKELSTKHNLDFVEAITLFSLEQNFFPQKTVPQTKQQLEQNFFKNYVKIKKSYSKKQIKKYITIYDCLFSEIKTFPIPKDFDDSGEISYVYADSWHAERNYGGKREHLGTDILDEENIRARIPIVSMTDGVIEKLGWNEKGGYRVGVRTEKNSYYYYAHLDTFAENLSEGLEVKAGTLLGYMGDTGYSKKEGTKGNFPVHLHLGISIDPDSTKKELWINPYPFLKYIENI